MKPYRKFLKSVDALKIVSVYAVFSALWILLSDQILYLLFKDPDTLTKLQMVKGWVFILVSSIIIFCILQKKIKRYHDSETALRESEKRLKAIFNHRFQLTGLLDRNGRLIMLNETVCRMAGIDCHKVTDTYLWQLPLWSHSEKLREKVQNAVQQVREGKAVSFETTHVTARGEIRDIEFSMTPVTDDIGDVVYIVPEGKDITTRKQSEKKLIESERNYKEIYNASSDAIFIHDAETGKIVDVNQAMLDMFGYTYQEALRLEVKDVSSTDPQFTQPIADSKIKKAVNEGIQLFEWRSRRKDGSCFWSEVSLNSTEIGGKGHVLALVRDISKRKKIDSELRMVKHSIERSTEPFFWIQENAGFVYVNQASCRSLGYTREELYSMRVPDIDPNFSIEIWPGFWDKVKSGKSLTFESSHCRKDGEIFSVQITTNYLEFEGREHLFAYAKDMSEKIKYENRQKNLEKQLQQALKVEAIGTLAGGIAHDFNNILSSIIGFSEIALEEVKKDSPLYFYIKEVSSAGQRARKLVDQILTFSRKQDSELKPLKIASVIKEAMKFVRSSIPATIEINRYIDPNCGLVMADPTKIHQVILNLCTNAYHAMRHDGGILSINLRPITRISDDNLSDDIFIEPGRYLELTISDTGHGITPKHLEKVFDPYFTTKEKGEGTGLGLSIVYSIIKDFNGYLAVKSDLGKGTTFKIYLPVFEGNQPVGRTPESSRPLPGGKEYVLFVDDEKGVADFSKIMLESLGYRVMAFTDSQQAFEAFKKSPDKFDIVMTDLTMPVMTGKELSRKILELKPEMPVVLCTGYGEQIASDKVQEAGGMEYLRKPVLKSEMALKVRNVLDRQKTIQ